VVINSGSTRGTHATSYPRCALASNRVTGVMAGIPYGTLYEWPTNRPQHAVARTA